MARIATREEAERLVHRLDKHSEGWATVTEQAVMRWRSALERGTVLVSPGVEAPRLLVGVIEEVADATDASVARRFSYAFVDERGNVEAAGPAPYLDCVAAPMAIQCERWPGTVAAAQNTSLHSAE